jgi:hypothetical protein
MGIGRWVVEVYDYDIALYGREEREQAARFPWIFM